MPDRPGRRRHGPHARRPARLHDVRRRLRRPRPAPLRREGAAGRDRDRRRPADSPGPFRRPVHAVSRQQGDDGVSLGSLVDEPDSRLRQDRPGRRPVPPAPPRFDLRRRARGRRPRPRGDAGPRRLEPDGDVLLAPPVQRAGAGDRGLLDDRSLDPQRRDGGGDGDGQVPGALERREGRARGRSAARVGRDVDSGRRPLNALRSLGRLGAAPRPVGRGPSSWGRPRRRAGEGPTDRAFPRSPRTISSGRPRVRSSA